MDDINLLELEIIVLELFSQGFSKREIDKCLLIGGGRIPMIQPRIIKKLNVASWEEAITIYQEQHRATLDPSISEWAEELQKSKL
jgi:DNA-binding CsgD family transcriptional regulator